MLVVRDELRRADGRAGEDLKDAVLGLLLTFYIHAQGVPVFIHAADSFEKDFCNEDVDIAQPNSSFTGTLLC